MVIAPGPPSYHQIREDLFRPLSRVSRRYMLVTIIAFIVGALGLVAWTFQLRLGMGVTGLQRPVFWGVYIVDFVFWIGVSHAGTLISAILRLTQAHWRAPITRLSEAMAVFSLVVGMAFALIHLGNPANIWRMVVAPQVGSPIVWDFVVIMTYLPPHRISSGEPEPCPFWGECSTSNSPQRTLASTRAASPWPTLGRCRQ